MRCTLRNAVLIVLAGSAGVAGLPDFACAQTLKNFEQAIRRNPQIGPLAGCYDDGIEASLRQIAVKAETEAQYKISLLILGGVPGVAMPVKQQCDLAFRQMPPTGGRDEIIGGMTPLFLEFIRVEHQKFMKDCVNARGSDSEKKALATLCGEAGQVDQKRRESSQK